MQTCIQMYKYNFETRLCVFLRTSYIKHVRFCVIRLSCHIQSISVIKALQAKAKKID